MMENLIISFEAVLPLFLFILLGMLLRRLGMLPENVRGALNKLCFKVFLPFYLFQSIYKTELSRAFDAKLMLFACVSLLSLFVLLMLLVPRIERDNSRRGVIIQGIFRSNFALFGLPVAEELCQDIGPTSLLLGVTVPIYNVLAVVCLESFRGGKPSVRKIAKGIATNPLIIASLLGILFNLIRVRTSFVLPEVILNATIVKLGAVATPLSLVALGSSFTFASVAGFRFQLSFTVFGKLIVTPLLAVALGVLLGFRGDTLVPLLIMFGAPTAVSSYPMAQQMDGDGDLAAAIVVFTSGFAILTIFLLIFALKQMGLI